MIDKFLLPGIVLFIFLCGVIKKNNIYNDFTNGAIEGLKIIIDIIPGMLAIIFGINIFIYSGIMNVFHSDIVPMFLLRPISGNASLGLLSHIYKTYGVDSYLGFLGSVLQGSTDTTIYVLALYFGSIHITKTRYALWVGLFADMVGMISAIIVSRIFF